MLHMICMERVKSFLMLINIVFHLASYKSANTIISHFMWDFLKILDSRGLLKGRSQVTSKTGNLIQAIVFFVVFLIQAIVKFLFSCSVSAVCTKCEKWNDGKAPKICQKKDGKKSWKKIIQSNCKTGNFCKISLSAQSRQCAKSARNGMTAKHQKAAKARTRVKTRRRSSRRNKQKKANKENWRRKVYNIRNNSRLTFRKYIWLVFLKYIFAWFAHSYFVHPSTEMTVEYSLSLSLSLYLTVTLYSANFV